MKIYKFVPLSLFESLYKVGIPVQSLNIFHVFSLLLFFKLSRFRLTPISKILIIFYMYALLTTSLNLIAVVAKAYDIIPFITFCRQFTGLSLGIITFFVLREIFIYYPNKALNFLVKTGITLSVISVFIFDIFLNHRFFRINATFTKPSHFGQFLVFIMIPSILLSDISKTFKKFLTLVVGVLIFLTFSFTTYIRLFIFLFFLFIFDKSIIQKIRYFSISILLIILGLWIFLEIFKYSYITYQVKSNLEAIFIVGSLEAGTVSLLDRIQLLFILKNFWQLGINGIWGIGLGLEKLYFNSLYPENVLNIILSVKQFESYLNSFWGKILVYTGISGLLIFLYLLVKAIKVSKILREKRFIMQATIFSIYIYALVGIALFQSIELWFWLAFLDSLHLNKKVLSNE